MIYAFGDIHGRFDLLVTALEAIRVRGDKDAQLIFLGDYVDRGPQSREVVELLIDLQESSNAICLRGNHEDMMAACCRMASYNEISKAWCKYGGKQTLASYGSKDNPYMAEWRKIPMRHVAWMESLPLYHDTPGRIFVHAGVVPGIPLAQHDPEEFMWARDDFIAAHPAGFLKHVVHGHTPYHDLKLPEEPELLDHRTNLDTMAFDTGILSVGVFDPTTAGGPVEVIAVTL